MQFSDIKGLDDVKDRLIQSVRKEQLPHALLFSGEKGSLNLPMALAFATYLNCTDKTDNDGCGMCPACVKNLKYIHPDLHFVFPVTAKAGIKSKDIISQTFLSQWREFVKEVPWAAEDTWAKYLGSEDKQFNISKEESRHIISDLSLKAFEGQFKIMLIWLPEYMHPSAANGILKILEEPADKTVFILVTNDRERLLSTILSRVITIPVRKLNQPEMAGYLVGERGLSQPEAEKRARMSDGSLEIALSEKTENEVELMVEFREWLLICHGFKRKDMVDFTEKFNRYNKLTQRSFLRYGTSVLRELIVLKSGAESVSRSSSAELDFLERLGQLMSFDKVEKASAHFSETLYLLERNVNAKTAFMDLSLSMTQLFRSK